MYMYTCSRRSPTLFQRHVRVYVFVGGFGLNCVLEWAGVGLVGMCHTHTVCVTHTDSMCHTHRWFYGQHTMFCPSVTGVCFLVFSFCKGCHSHRLSGHNKYVSSFRNGRFYFVLHRSPSLSSSRVSSYRNGRFLLFMLFHCSGRYAIRHHNGRFFFFCTGRHPSRHLFPPSITDNFSIRKRTCSRAAR